MYWIHMEQPEKAADAFSEGFPGINCAIKPAGTTNKQPEIGNAGISEWTLFIFHLLLIMIEDKKDRKKWIAFLLHSFRYVLIFYCLS